MWPSHVGVIIIPAEAEFESDTVSMRTPRSNRNIDVFLRSHCLSVVILFTSFLPLGSEYPMVNHLRGLAIHTPREPPENMQLQRVPQSVVLRQGNPSQVGLKYGLFKCLVAGPVHPNAALRPQIATRVIDTISTLIPNARSMYIISALIVALQ